MIEQETVLPPTDVDADDKAPAAKQVVAASLPDDTPQTSITEPEPVPAPEPEPEPEPLPPVTFASRRKQPPPPLQPRSEPAAEPVFAARFAAGPRGALDELHAEPPVSRNFNGVDTTPMPVTAAHTADMVDPADKRRAAREKAVAAGTAIAGTLGKIGQGTAAGMRKLRTKPAAPPPQSSEAEAMTVFGARGRNQVGGKPRFLGLILTVLLLVALGILALWSTYFLNDATSGWFGDIEEVPEVAAIDSGAVQQPDLPAVLPETTPTITPETLPAATVEAAPETNTAIDEAVEAALQAALTEPDAAAEDAGIADEEAADLELALLEQPDAATPGPDRISQPPPTPAQAEASYAATGIWQLDPAPLGSPTGGDRLDDVYVASIDPNILSQDAVALPNSSRLLDDLRPVALAPPPSLGTRFDLDERGLVRATPEGALTPEGVTVFSGSPVVNPGARPGTPAPIEQETEITLPTTPTAEVDAEPEIETPAPAPELTPEQLRLAAIRPTLRPSDLIETTERARLGGFSRDELALIRPTVRPPSLQEEQAAEIALALAEAAQPDPEAGAETETGSEVTVNDGTELAVLNSLLPATRPGNFSRVVEKAREEAAANPEPEPEKEVTASVAPAVTPSIPSRASVARQATEQNAINLGKVNLIGVYGSPSDRRALVRLKSGRYVKVEVGDRVDGGRVAAIGDTELRYVKGGRNITLKLPKG